MPRKLVLSSAVLLVLTLSLVVSVEADSTMWSQTYGGTKHDEAHSLVVTSDGGYALAGNTLSFGAGSSDFWLVKTDEFGNMEWNQTYGYADWEWCASLVATSDGGYALAGLTQSVDSGDFLLVKTNSFGNMEWNQTYGGTGWQDARGLVETPDGGYALAGTTNSLGAGESDWW